VTKRGLPKENHHGDRKTNHFQAQLYTHISRPDGGRAGLTRDDLGARSVEPKSTRQREQEGHTGYSSPERGQRGHLGKKKSRLAKKASGVADRKGFKRAVKKTAIPYSGGKGQSSGNGQRGDSKDSKTIQRPTRRGREEGPSKRRGNSLCAIYESSKAKRDGKEEEDRETLDGDISSAEY